MAISFSRPDPASPASVSSAQFPTARKGYDQSEVRDFLRMVAAEQARLQERERFLERELRSAQQAATPNMATIDEDTATRLLGEEAARVLTTAREAATQIRQRAEEGSARLLREATDEAQRLREEAEIEAARRRQDAAADSEAELQMAKQQGRDMVNEARAYRERVLSELARRRELARQQIEQLIHGRDRLLQAFERSRIAAVEVMAELTPLGEPDEYVNLQPTTGPVPIMVPTREPAGQPDLTLVPDLDEDEQDGTVALTLEALVAAETASAAESIVIGERSPEVAADAIDDAPDESSNVSSEGAPDHTSEVAPDHVSEVAHDGVVDIDAPDEAADDAAGDVAHVGEEDMADVVELQPEAGAQDADPAIADDPEYFLDDSATPLDENWSAPVATERPQSQVEATDAEHEHDDNVVELFAPNTESAAEPTSDEAASAATSPPGGTVDDLFARLRAARSDVVARKVNDAEPVAEPAVEPVAETDLVVAGSVLVDEEPPAPAPDPDEAVIPLIVAVARKLKRVLADEQNELLDTLRRKEPVRSIDTLLSWDGGQDDRYASAVEADLVLAAVAGANGNEDGRNPAIVRPASDAVTNEIVAPLRERLTRCIDKADGNNTDLANQVRSLYREWKTHRIDEHVETIVRLAFDRGALTVTTS